MTSEEMKKEFEALYNMMASSNKVEYMHTFGQIHKEMFDWFVKNKPTEAEEFLNKLESIRWKNYLTPKEAETIVDNMEPSAPWSKEQWKSAMEKHGYDVECVPYYNRYALFATMNMEMSDSKKTLEKYINGDKLFDAVYELAVDKLTDKDGNFNVRKHWSL